MDDDGVGPYSDKSTRQYTDLVVLGIVASAPCGQITQCIEGVIVGSVIMRRGYIELVPRLHLDALQRSRLAAAALQVYLFGLRGLQGWRFHPEIGWIVGVRMPAGQSSDLRFRARISSMCSSVSRTPPLSVRASVTASSDAP